MDNEIGEFESFDDYLKNYDEMEAKNFSGKKVVFAEKIRPYLSKENLSQHLDLDDNMKKLLAMINKWNPS